MPHPRFAFLPLPDAASEGLTEMVRELLQHEPDQQVIDEALRCAIQSSQPGIATMLLPHASSGGYYWALADAVRVMPDLVLELLGRIEDEGAINDVLGLLPAWGAMTW